MQVYCDPLYRRYHAPICSCAFIYFLCTFVTLLTLPFYMARDNQTLWARILTYVEQPDVKFSHKLNLLVEGEDNAGSPFSAYFSSIREVNNLHMANIRVPVVESHSVDSNHDGKVDSFHFNAFMLLNAGEKVHSVKLLLFFTTRLQEKVHIEMDTLVFVHKSSSIPGRSLNVNANYNFKQSWPLRVTNTYLYPYSKTPLLDSKSLNMQSDTLFEPILNAYSSRNYTMEMNGGYSLWSGDTSLGYVNPSEFSISVILRIDEQNIVYWPLIGEMLRIGWVQYAAMFIVIWAILNKLNSFVYSAQLVQTRVFEPNIVNSDCGKFHYN